MHAAYEFSYLILLDKSDRWAPVLLWSPHWKFLRTVPLPQRRNGCVIMLLRYHDDSRCENIITASHSPLREHSVGVCYSLINYEFLTPILTACITKNIEFQKIIFPAGPRRVVCPTKLPIVLTTVGKTKFFNYAFFVIQLLKIKVKSLYFAIT